ncbi:MAG: hypothetical protein NZ455_12610 [Bacteroidia bacterium]|nr:hypothetical protein [Bacteroidia bacterium]MDW8346323.1 hypothetical protein [Bacteroidia bacterium]
MRRVLQQCGARAKHRSEAQPAARRPEAQRRDTPTITNPFFIISLSL